MNPIDADAAARIVLTAHDAWAADFGAVTRRARERFAARDWHAGQADAVERLHLYPAAVDDCVDDLRDRLSADEAGAARDAYAGLTEGRPDAEVARTFFSSVVRRVLGTTGTDAATEFTGDGAGDGEAEEAPSKVHEGDGVSPALFSALLGGCEVADLLADRQGDAAACAAAAREQLGADAERVRAAEVLPALFYRNKAAYLVGRLRLDDGETRPLLVPLLHADDGVRPDAVLLSADEVHVVFSFARAYFHVDTDRPGGVVAFLRTLMPVKPLHEVYAAIGHGKHAKTVLYRELTRHLAGEEVRFEPQEGQRGLVMAVFVLPAFNVVFKVIRDRFGASKADVTRARVRDRYRLVYSVDRVGRLVDAHEFENLEFPADRFSPQVLKELTEEAAESVSVEGGRVRVRHLYVTRRLRPLDVHLREASRDDAAAAVVEYGDAIRDLASVNLFPGDLLLKNFGISRHGRVIFYDYDELSLLTDVRFRSLPTARDDADEMSAEPWYSVDEGDVFPEEWIAFLVPPGPLRQAFLARHADLLTPAFWRGMQERQRGKEIPDFFPYPRERRLNVRETRRDG